MASAIIGSCFVWKQLIGSYFVWKQLIGSYFVWHRADVEQGQGADGFVSVLCLLIS